jgi:FlaA1/EpsC-like NDP-sugar epimerase
LELGDIREPARLDEILDKYAVNSIFHAAAYKHVPMLERHICEATKNNVLGTWNLVEAACRNGVSTFVMISTDKAVNPTSVMGVSKRIAELIVTAKRDIAQGAIPRFVCLRFGNVLVSNGSVVPTFQKQIAAGGPVTVTHPEMRRYFMTVQEAVQLVLHASAMGMQSEILVLDMGSPVRILDLARKMITLAGFVPDEDIEIRFTGLRPGEKLFEELKIDSETVLPSTNEKIKIFRGEQLTIEEIEAWIGELRSLLERGEPSMLLEHFRRLVPEYCGTLTPAQEPLSASSPRRHAVTVAYTATQAAAS